jgi:hypothetical protein
MDGEMTPERFWLALNPQLSEGDLSDLTWDGVIQTLRASIERNRKTIEWMERRHIPVDNMRRQMWERAACAAMNGFLSVEDPEDNVVTGAAIYADALVDQWAKRFEKAPA